MLLNIINILYMYSLLKTKFIYYNYIIIYNYKNLINFLSFIFKYIHIISNLIHITKFIFIRRTKRIFSNIC